MSSEDAERTEERLRGIASAASVLLFLKESDVGREVEAIAGTLPAPHRDGDIIRVLSMAPPGGRRRGATSLGKGYRRK